MIDCNENSCSMNDVWVESHIKSPFRSLADSDLTALTIDVPHSLRAVQPFLHLSQKLILYLCKPQSSDNSVEAQKVLLASINRAFKMVAILNVNLDTSEDNGVGRECLENYRQLRDRIAVSLSAPLSSICEYNRNLMSEAARQSCDLLKSFAPHAPEIILLEADEVLALAEELRSNGFFDLAADHYHTASVYYRVMESVMMSKMGCQGNMHNSHVHKKLMYAAWNSRQGSSLAENIPGEFFADRSCADVYEINGNTRLGKGSYGSVYLATHRITGDERAVKVMNVDRVTSYYLRKLHTEISILRSLDHPNIIGLQDVFFGRRSVYLVTPLCRGGELFELLNTGKSKGFVFKEDRTALLVRDMLSAVHYLHQNGIVHRDLKLENFLFEQQRLDSPLVLIDFGLARRFEPGERMTQRVGSCYYTAPEVLLGNYDHTCDVWSVGVLMYMLLSGSPPFAGKDPDEVYANIGSQEAVYPEKRFGHLSPQCKDFLRRLLTKNPAERITTGEALRHPYITETCKANWAPHTQALSQAQVDRVADSLWAYLTTDPLTRLLLYLVAFSLPTEQITELRSEYYSMDVSHSGAVSLQDFCLSLQNAQLVREGRLNLARAHLHLCGQGGRNSGLLSYRTYVAACIPNRVEISTDRARQVFQSLDPDQQGFVTADSMRKYVGASLPQEQLDAMIAACLANGNPNLSPLRPACSANTQSNANLTTLFRFSSQPISTLSFEEETMVHISSMDTDCEIISSSRSFSCCQQEREESLPCYVTEEVYFRHLCSAGVCSPQNLPSFTPYELSPSPYKCHSHGHNRLPKVSEQYDQELEEMTPVRIAELVDSSISGKRASHSHMLSSPLRLDTQFMNVSSVNCNIQGMHSSTKLGFDLLTTPPKQGGYTAI